MSSHGAPIKEPLISTFNPPRDQKPILAFAAVVVIVAIIIAIAM